MKGCAKRAPGAEVAVHTGSALAEGLQDITKAWAHYTEEVMRQTAGAGPSLIGCRSLTEMFEIQSQFCAATCRQFLNQSSRLPKIAGRMATSEAFKQAREAQPEAKKIAPAALRSTFALSPAGARR
jgi:hypothetical protein